MPDGLVGRARALPGRVLRGPLERVPRERGLLGPRRLEGRRVLRVRVPPVRREPLEQEREPLGQGRPARVPPAPERRVRVRPEE
ncbi:hypothetical protein ABT104_19460, partial [Streptomyces mobaraensis]|uniref:hypothetical protein n=1 Tax=Streptomyces mobaraensis TaxID=35621 RepID=UPI00332D88FC